MKYHQLQRISIARKHRSPLPASAEVPPTVAYHMWRDDCPWKGIPSQIEEHAKGNNTQEGNIYSPKNCTHQDFRYEEA